jgi:hypothetical protein
MRELLITNNPVLLGYVEVLLADQGINAIVFDQHISLVEGGIAAFPRRLMVSDDDWYRAARIMREASLSEWVNDSEDA